jgi:hypothetical protein
MTSELLVALFDAAHDRLTLDHERRVDEQTMAAIFASGKEGHKAYQRWKGKVARASSRPTALAGMALERAVRGLAQTHPEYVVMA